MARGTGEDRNGNLAELMQAVLITELGRACVAQAAIREIAGCDMNRVSQIVKPIDRERRRISKAQMATNVKFEKKLDTIIRFAKRLAH